MILVRDNHYTVDVSSAWESFKRREISIEQLAAAVATALRNNSLITGLPEREELEPILAAFEEFTGTWDDLRPLRQRLAGWCIKARVSITSY